MMADSYQFTLDWDLPAAASIASARGAAPIGGVCSHAHRAVPRAAKWFWMLVGAGGMYWFLSRRAQRQALLARAQAKRKIAGAGNKGKTAKVQKEEWVIRLSKEVVGAEEDVGDELDADTDEDDRDGVQVRRKTVCLNRAEATETVCFCNGTVCEWDLT